MIKALKTAFFGANGGLTKGELLALSERDKFSDYLPWVAYQNDSKIFYNVDNTVGFMWECAPVLFSGESTVKTLEGLFRVHLPESAIMQFILHADPYVDPVLDAFKRMSYRDEPLLQEVTEHVTKFYKDGVFGMQRLANIPIRNFRLFFTCKMPAQDADKINMDDLHGTITETLRGAGLCPETMEVEHLLDWSRRLFNDNVSEINNSYYDDRDIIRRQVMLGTKVERKFKAIKIDSRYFRCITPRSYPLDVDPLQTNKLFGGIMGLPSDSDQIRSPFIYTLNILMADTKGRLRTKCELILKQQGFGSFASSLNRKKDEHTWAMDAIDRGTRFYRSIPTLWIYGQDENVVNDSVARARRIWDSQGYVMQEDRGILPILLVSSLPFGLYDVGKNVNSIDRDFVAPSDALSSILPVQGDFRGFGKPSMLFVGRKGQLFGMDLFDKSANNHNAFIAATSGGGKSFFTNYMVFNYYRRGAKIRIIDIGGSYKKMCHLFGARYLDFSEETQICLNPFTFIRDEEKDLQIIVPIVAAMCFSSGGDPNSVEMELLNQAVRWAWSQKKTEAGVDDVAMFLNGYQQICSRQGGSVSTEVVEAAARLAFTIQNFTSSGAYGRFFNGPSTFDISNDDFVVLELQNLKGHPALYKVITLQVIDAVTRDLYLSDRSERRMIIFDEAFEFLGDSSLIADVIEEGYRRARKYFGSFTIITQSIMDLRQFGAVGDVIRSNSAFKFYLESPVFEQARQEKLINYDDFAMSILNSTKSNKPNYSEIFMETPHGVGVGRLAVDPFSYYVFTSDGEEISEIESMVESGVDYKTAINEMVRKYRS